jgi:hypothetical protein
MTELALGGEARVPAPDPIATDYLLLALRLDQHLPGFVDGYFGPARLKAQVDLESLRAPALLAADAGRLARWVDAEVDEPRRRAWLTAQLRAIEANARALVEAPAGVSGPAYLAHVSRCFDWTPERRPAELFEAARTEIDRILPGTGSTIDRLARWDARLVVAPDRLPAIIEWLVSIFRERAAATFGLPDGEALRVSLVRDQPWSGYNWYDGNLRSRVDLNTDLPIRAPDLLSVLAHETYPGHHLEHAWKETQLVRLEQRLECSILLINTPECLISEGLADLGRRFAVPAADETELLIELFQRAGLVGAADPAGAADLVRTTLALRAPRALLAEFAVNAALRRHVDGADHDTVRTELEQTALLTPEHAEKRLEFIEHPLWRTYVFVYSEGEALLRRWLGTVPDADAPARFSRLLREQITPALIVAELGPPA